MIKCLYVENIDSLRVERFKQSTREKLRGVRCPDHHRQPRLQFQGASLHEITITMSGCCAKLMDLANARIASETPAESKIQKPA